jgi:hypothetical protein
VKPHLKAWIWWEDTKTGEVGFYDESKKAGLGSVWLTDDWGHLNEVDWFMWEDGNYACDCNRGIMFGVVPYDEAKCSEDRFEILTRGVWDETL